jgi:hypothetical protein
VDATDRSEGTEEADEARGIGRGEGMEGANESRELVETKVV